MEASFWHQRWGKGEIGFHEKEVNPLLCKYFGNLHLAQGARVFLPLCGKTRDIAWLLANGYQVAGAELSELAIRQLFAELGLVPDLCKVGNLLRYQANNISIFVGDIFDMTAELLGPIAAIYDRAALVALPLEMRNRYAPHLAAITSSAPQLLITFEYDQQQMAGPPFSITADEVKRHYSAPYQVIAAETRDVAGGMKGKIPATETVWLLQASNVAITASSLKMS